MARMMGTSKISVPLPDNNRVGFFSCPELLVPTESSSMSNYHVNPATGNALYCDEPKDCVLGLRVDDHYGSMEDAVNNDVARWRDRLRTSMVDLNVDEFFVEQLSESLVEGFTIASSKGSRLYDSQISLLFTTVGVGHLVNLILLSPRQRIVRSAARALNWVVREQVIASRSGFAEIFEKTVTSFLPDRTSRGVLVEVLDHNTKPPAPDELSRVAAGLWAFRDSPFHELAKALIHGAVSKSTGYVPNPVQLLVEVPHTHEILSELNISFESLPSNVLAYDVETDTQNGFGLLPRKTQITEIVVSSKDRSWVMAGDERFVLSSFAKLLNDQRGHHELAGWNNRASDNVMLQTRAEFHGTPHWNGRLIPAPNASRYEPMSPSGLNQSLVWKANSGVTFRDVDVFQDKILADRSVGCDRTPGLKTFVEGLGGTPIKVDRNFLHELTEKERMAYVLSDGIGTLRSRAEML